MATYRAIKGQKIQKRSGNPNPLIIGQMFVDTATNTLKIVYADGSGNATVGTIALTS
tara:strand:- start:6064 stop:6234 length:171 start_codon:yes stop_codon:yes gene_type:complete